ncbi:DUF1269 domain-containing protein [Crateriforma conspicua]|uniref:DUF1269 domain-containing protein n=1 Tax=Crateriforma conspicua TaxID=2527996 RepID=A0A5C5Y404_9PLAN|nr:DUF1269 domain-containing protein [Crateriforma conspicua]QDV64072.1 hypothetical protein Mal65_32210 [Crateriforma conspicua]TWT69463.1 hypothetical protein Pan14r_17500 [Crateriforma conspicua]
MSSITPRQHSAVDKNCLIAEFRRDEAFRNGLLALQKARFDEQQISTVVRSDELDNTKTPKTGQRTANKVDSEKLTSATTMTGGLVGGAIGAASLVGPFLVAGPIAGMAVGAVGGGLIAALTNTGVQTENAKTYQQRVEEGSRLIIMEDEPLKLREAERILKTVDPVTLEVFLREGDAA